MYLFHFNLKIIFITLLIFLSNRDSYSQVYNYDKNGEIFYIAKKDSVYKSYKYVTDTPNTKILRIRMVVYPKLSIEQFKFLIRIDHYIVFDDSFDTYSHKIPLPKELLNKYVSAEVCFYKNDTMYRHSTIYTVTMINDTDDYIDLVIINRAMAFEDLMLYPYAKNKIKW